MFRSALQIFVLAAVLASSSLSASLNAPFGDLVDVDGNKVTTAANLGNGKWQLVMIWATNCHVCAEMKPKLSEFHNEHKDIDAQVYGVALDGHDRIDEVKQYMQRHNVSFPTFVGELGLVAANFELNSQVPLRGTPTYLLFNPAGELMAIDYGMLNIDAIERFMARNT